MRNDKPRPDYPGHPRSAAGHQTPRDGQTNDEFQVTREDRQLLCADCGRAWRRRQVDWGDGAWEPLNCPWCGLKVCVENLATGDAVFGSDLHRLVMAAGDVLAQVPERGPAVMRARPDPGSPVTEVQRG